MLDTNTVSAMVGPHRHRIAESVRRVGETAICLSIISAAELRYGVRKKGSPALAKEIDDILKAMTVVPMDAPADAVYGDVRHALTSTGQAIGPIDFLIAAHALTLDLTLVTANTREFSRVPNLRVENWLD